MARGCRRTFLIGLATLPAVTAFDTPMSAQRQLAARLMPAQLQQLVSARAPGQLRVARLRVWADQDYRRVGKIWQSQVRELLGRVNAFVEPAFNLRFEAAVFRNWDRRGSAARVEDALQELFELDPGDGVDFVLGLVTGLPLVTTSIHGLGAAHQPGRHLVMRQMVDLEEMRALRASLDLLDFKELEELYFARKAHKELVVFLHEWAHAMGAMHGREREAIMNPSWSEREQAFSLADAQLCAIAVDHRLRDSPDPAAEARALLDHIDQTRDAEWSDKDRRTALEFFAARAGGVAPSGTARASGVTAVRLAMSKEDVDRYNDAVKLYNDKDTAGARDGAFAIAGPLAVKYPDELFAQRLSCRLLPQSGRDGGGRQACGRAMALALVALDPEPPLEAAVAFLQIEDNEAALRAAREASALADKRDGGKPEVMAQLARVHLQLSSLTAAESAATRAAGANGIDELVTTITRERRRLGLPRDAARFGVVPDSEPAYAREHWAAAEALEKNDMVRADRLLRDASLHFAGAPGLQALACELHLRRGRTALAKPRCEAAIAAFDETVRAHLWLGVLAANARKSPTAVVHLERAIALDPGTSAAWRTLARVYRTQGRGSELGELGTRHQKLLGIPLDLR
jgi:tetratricopeptide (TPR) repeat protein